uniref:Uncharacterized protein n=1 Tax=Setaria italica TaxID=4555 RepID=K3YFT0_SETIT
MHDGSGGQTISSLFPFRAKDNNPRCTGSRHMISSKEYAYIYIFNY